MKNRIIFFTLTFIVFSCFNSCISIKEGKEKDKFLIQFFNNESVYNSLKDYYSQKEIIIYDEKKELVDIPKLFEINSNRLKIEIIKPKAENYFLIYSFILNDNLSMLVLSTSDGEKGIIYYIRRKNKIESWKIINIIPKNRY